VEGQTILITGMSGIKIEKCLQKFISEYKNFRTSMASVKPILLKLDTEIENAFYEINPSIKKSKQVWKDTILKQTYHVLQILWNKAFQNILSKVHSIKQENPEAFIFINIHSCYYHNRTQEYIPLFRIEELSKLEPTKIITIIDDIFDIHHRLTKTGGIYHDETNISKTMMILRLLRLLDWRAKETMLSRHIANELNIKNYIFAVKHSFDTFSNLIFQETKKVYLSHPITEVRRLEQDGRDVEVRNILSEITDISDRLSYEFTTFLPTTIDEFRIFLKKAEDGLTRDFYPILTKRWEEEYYNRHKELLFISSEFKDENELWSSYKNDEVILDGQINQLLAALADFISDQVTVRDYTLVEQSDMLVIYRPLFNGNASGGVREEFRYYKKLIKDTNKEILCFIYCPLKDINRYYIRQFELKVINEVLEEENLIMDNPDKFSLSMEEGEKLLFSLNDKNLLLDFFDEVVIDKHNAQIKKTNIKTPLSGNRISDYKEQFAKEVMLQFESIQEYMLDITLFESDNNLSIEEFIKKIKNQLN
jgi:hypothetical protein